MDFTFFTCTEIEKRCVKCTTCCNSKKWHCPLCPTLKFKPNRLAKVISHIRSTHWNTRVRTLNGKHSIVCRLFHGRSHKNHFHCPLCDKEIQSKNRVLDHVQRCGKKGEDTVEIQLLQESGTAADIPMSSPGEPSNYPIDTVMKVRTPRKKTPCEICGIFLLQKNMSEHKRAKHEKIVDPLTPRVKVACDSCGKMLFKRNILKHKRSKHGMVRDKQEKQALTIVATDETCAQTAAEQPATITEEPHNVTPVEPHTKVEETGEVLSDVFKALSYRPGEFQAFNNYYSVLMSERGNLTRADKKIIMTVMSAKNNYLFCIDAHGTLVRIYVRNSSLSDQVAANLKTADLDDRMKAILEFAMDIDKCAELTEDRFSNLQRHGLDREDAWDIGAMAAFISMSNRLGFLSKMKPNPELVLTLGSD